LCELWLRVVVRGVGRWWCEVVDALAIQTHAVAHLAAVRAAPRQHEHVLLWGPSRHTI
jgi:hypothetical protein